MLSHDFSESRGFTVYHLFDLISSIPITLFNCFSGHYTRGNNFNGGNAAFFTYFLTISTRRFLALPSSDRLSAMAFPGPSRPTSAGSRRSLFGQPRLPPIWPFAGREFCCSEGSHIVGVAFDAHLEFRVSFEKRSDLFDDRRRLGLDIGFARVKF